MKSTISRADVQRQKHAIVEHLGRLRASTRAELAALLGITRKVCGRRMEEMRKRGLLDLHGATIHCVWTLAGEAPTEDDIALALERKATNTPAIEEAPDEDRMEFIHRVVSAGKCKPVNRRLLGPSSVFDLGV